MDNLYNSGKFGKIAKMSDKKVLISGVIRKDNRGVPSIIYQEEKKSKSGKIDARNTIKAAVLKGDDVCDNFIMLSLYDTKPFYYFTTCAKNLKWEKVTRKVWNAKKKRKIECFYLKLNVIND